MSTPFVRSILRSPAIGALTLLAALGCATPPPTADAGPDQTVDEGVQVTLTAAGSTVDGGTLGYAWSQSGGPAVSLSDVSAVSPTFTAPSVAGGTSVEFALTVTDDAGRTDTDAVSVDVRDTTEATASASPDGDAAVHDSVVVTFSEAMNPASLTLAGDLAALSDGGTWSAGDTVLTVTPASGAWESGARSLEIDVDDLGGNPTQLTVDLAIRLAFSNFQAASIVLGQADFTGGAANRSGSVTAETLSGPYGTPTWIDGRLWVPEYDNNRVLGFEGVPTESGAAATWVLGQADLHSNAAGTSASAIAGPQALLAHEGRYYLLDYDNNRMLIYDAAPLTAPATASAVLGQPDLSSNGASCSAQGFSGTEAMSLDGGRLLVVDSGNNRVLIWNTIPTSGGVAPDLVLGQVDFTTCAGNDDDGDGLQDAAPSARTFWYPNGVWTDGTRLIVSDYTNDRLLIWTEFPTTSFQPADLVVGQGDFDRGDQNDDDQDGATDATASDRTLNGPYGLWSNGLQLVSADYNNHRVLIWDEIPTASFARATWVLGQADFEGFAPNDDDQDGSEDAAPSARVFNQPSGVSAVGDALIVTDALNNRALVFESD